MSVLKRTSLYALGFISVSLTILTDSAPAASEAPNAWQLLAGCAERVQELEAEVEALRHQLREERQARNTRRSADGHGSGAPLQSECDVPFEISLEGIKHVKEQCMHALQSDSCDVPYVLDSRGVKTFKRACVQQ